ncbi:MAG: GNAT family N-acetyltransferase [Actinomycetaceae bacterium]|nr:GNAT family N-acetyltransferase [Actinomycetaceae bacterium]
MIADASIITRIQTAAMLDSLQQGVDGPLGGDLQLDTDAMTRTWEQTIARPAQPGYRVLSALNGGRVVGFSATVPSQPVEGNEWLSQPGIEIIALEVEASAVGEGHRSRLLAACTDLAIEEGAHIVSTWIIAGDDARIRLFHEAGLRPGGLQRVLPVGPHRISQHLWWAQLGQ